MWREISESDESNETLDSVENSMIKTPSKSDSGEKFFKSKTGWRRRGERTRNSQDSSLNNSNDSKYLSPMGR